MLGPSIAGIVLPLCSLLFLISRADGLTSDASIISAQLLGILGFVAVAATFTSYFNRMINRWVALLVMFTAGFLHILLYAKIYQFYGIELPPDEMLPGFSTFVFFSASTFTTLGFADFKPSEDTLLVVVGQAFMGYLYLGFIVSACFDIGNTRQSAGGVSPELIRDTLDLVKRSADVVESARRHF